MQKILLGGTTHVTGGMTAYKTSRLSTWHDIDPQRAVYEIMGGAAASDFTTRQQFLEHLIVSMDIAGTLRVFLKTLHEALAVAFVRAVDGADVSQMAFSESRDEHPANYTQAMSRLKNMQFDDWSGHDMLGFCPMEPVVRLQQLLQFPAERFGFTFDTDYEFPSAPTPLTGDLRMRKQQVYEVTQELQLHVEQWEAYYVQLNKCFARLSQQLVEHQPAVHHGQQSDAVADV